MFALVMLDCGDKLLNTKQYFLLTAAVLLLSAAEVLMSGVVSLTVTRTRQLVVPTFDPC